MRADTTGKICLDDIYTRPDPRAYFSTLRELDYYIPQLAKPHFRALIREYRDATGVRNPTVLDIGCSYGINAALLKCDATMDELYERYSGPGAAELSVAALLERDRELVRSRAGTADGVRFIGLDSSGPALAYATGAGFVDGAVHADLEENEPDPAQRELLAAADLVISTGCVGYVTERTLGRIVDAAPAGRLPWMAHFVLRMFPFDPVEKILDAAGYETVHPAETFRQRRFANAGEQAQVLETLSAAGVDPGGPERDGWLSACLHVSRPAAR
ncbi:class I SAM-dependent methyltransferase [Spirillospora sp. NPDC029432]|uniref:class I SAM-dependent methyltransferase n=1 Tax=Spirillospora sp. NPDC029432 TaxID=3154599 RepID=UPI003452D3D1